MKLKYHMDTHNQSGFYQCTECGKYYSQSYTLKTHKCKPPPGGVHAANESGEKGQVQVVVQDFVLPAEGEVPSGKESAPSGELYMCSVCDKIFNTWDEIQNHLTEHTDDLPIDESENSKIKVEQVNMVASDDSEVTVMPSGVKIANLGGKLVLNDPGVTYTITDGTIVHTSQLTSVDVETATALAHLSETVTLDHNNPPQGLKQ